MKKFNYSRIENDYPEAEVLSISKMLLPKPMLGEEKGWIKVNIGPKYFITVLENALKRGIEVVEFLILRDPTGWTIPVEYKISQLLVD